MLNRIYLRRLLPGIAALAAVLFPAVLSAASLRSAPDPWPTRHFESEAGGIHIPFEFTKGHIFVTVSVNGNPGYIFLLDSGTSIDILDLTASRNLGIPIENIKRARDLGLGGGKVEMAGAKHLSLRIQDSHAQSELIGTSAAIVDLHGLASVMNHRIDGIIGYPLLRQFVVGINFESDELTLWPQREFHYHGNGDVMQLAEQRDNVPAIPITVNTQNRKTRQALVEIDTGSDATLLLYPKYAKRARIDDAFFSTKTKMKPGDGYGLGGLFPILPAIFASMTMGNIQVIHFMAFMMQTSPAVTRRKIAGVIGTTVLSSYKRVIFDVSRSRVIFELRPPPPPLAQTARLGN
ncbi:MAG: hypothetical protein ACP5M4_13345 [Acidobacteriaceae bacterium]